MENQLTTFLVFHLIIVVGNLLRLTINKEKE